MQIIPAIDLIDGRCVRLTQGDYQMRQTYGHTPLQMAQLFESAGATRIHVVDLDGAKSGCPQNLSILEQIVQRTALQVEWGGGVKTDAHLRDVLQAGAAAVIVGSVAVHDPGRFEQWLGQYGPERMILGADVKDGLVATQGWQHRSQQTIDDLLTRFCPQGLRQLIVTDISRDGMLQGPNLPLYADLQQRWPQLCLCVSGGIASADDIRQVARMGLPRVIVGKAIYEGRISAGLLGELIREFV